MKFRKLISVVCALSIIMALCVAPLGASADTAVPAYYIWEDYAENDIGGWQRGNAVTNAYTGAGNYAVEYTANAGGDIVHNIRKINGNDGLALVSGKDIMVETRVLVHSASGNTKLYFGMNNNRVSNPNGQGNGAIFLIWPCDANGLGSNPGKTSIPHGGGNYDRVNVPGGGGSSEVWFNIKLKLLGDTGKADLLITLDNGTVVWNVANAYFPANNGAATPTDMNHDVFEQLAVSVWRDTCTTLVDYLRVYPAGSTITNTTVAPYMAATSDITVNFATTDAGIRDLTSAVELYAADGVTVVPSTKVLDSTGKKVIIKATGGLNIATSYVVKVDSAKVLGYGYDSYSGPTTFNVQTYACSATNVTVTGGLFANTQLVADYTFAPDPSTEGASTYRWQRSANGTDWTDIPGADSKTLDVTPELASSGHYVRFGVLPRTNIGGVGEEAFSTPVVPQKAPVASNLTYNVARPYSQGSLKAIYDYTDENGDLESGTVINWYVGDTADSCNTLIESAPSVVIDDVYEGKYIKYTVIPKNNASVLNEGTMVSSVAIGPIVDMKSGTNVVPDGGFESGVLDPNWMNVGGNSIAITDTTAYSGTKSLWVNYRPANQQYYGYPMEIEAGESYIFSGYVKAFYAAYTEYRTYWWNSIVTTSAPKWSIAPNTWTYLEEVVTANGDGTVSPSFVTFVKYNEPENQIFVDDFYLGKLMIGIIDADPLPDTVIPKISEGNVVVYPHIRDIYNQIGTRGGLTSEKVELSIYSGEGIYINDAGNGIVITPDAKAGDVIIKYTVDQLFQTNQPPYEELVKLKLLPNNDTMPRVSNVYVDGTVAEGNTLEINYDFYQINNKADLSTYQWGYATTYDGEFVTIDGATSKTFVVPAALKDYFITCRVTPKAAGEFDGKVVEAVKAAKLTAPTAKNIKITGKMSVGETVTGTYEFFDVNYTDVEGASTYQWYISQDDDSFAPISGATNKNLTITAEMIDKYLKFGVIPVSDNAPTTGAECFSPETIGPTAPTITDLKIEKQGSIYKASYKYYHPNGLSEKNTKYAWRSGHIIYTDKVTFEPDFEGTKTVRFEITPGCEGTPSTGETYYIDLTIEGKKPGYGGFAGAGGGGGGTGGGGGGTTYVPPVTPVEPIIEVNDIADHWGKDFIIDMVRRDVMDVDSDGNISPDKIIPRAEMITYLFKALGLETAEYEGVFSDVSATDEYAGYIQAMLNNGTISEYDTFRPFDPISREEMCKILYISLENAGKLKKVENDLISGLSDYSSISDWGREYVNSMFGNGIIIGVSETEFAPQDNVTKAQVATMLTRILKLIEE